MSKFFVGQRVKCVRTDSSLRPSVKGMGASIGDIGVVAGTMDDPNLGFWSDGCDVLSVKLDRFGVPGIGPAYCFEPILYDGAQPIEESFEEMMGKLREGVIA